MSDSDPVLTLAAQTGDGSETFTISVSPATVGRATGRDFQINARDVSSQHAVFQLTTAGDWLLEDSGSTNGTFVNGERITSPRRLHTGDLVHFATQGYRILDGADGGQNDNQTIIMGDTAPIRGNIELLEVLEQSQLYSHFQPIFDVASREPVAWEALGRGVAGGEPMPPGKMFGLAERFNLNHQLSQGMREAAIGCVSCGHCWNKPPDVEIWINLHPAEVMHPDFESDVRSLQSKSSAAKFAAVIEAPETWVSRSNEMRDLVAKVREAGMRVAYDDFGAGQSRLEDLMSVPPDYIKFDRALITNIADDPVKHDLLEAMIKACNTLNTITLAEGVETEAEFAACERLGVKLIQGFYLERPRPAFELFGQDTAGLPKDCQYRRLGMV